jgi:hypothetical protein
MPKRVSLSRIIGEAIALSADGVGFAIVDGEFHSAGDVATPTA